MEIKSWYKFEMYDVIIRLMDSLCCCTQHFFDAIAMIEIQCSDNI